MADEEVVDQVDEAEATPEEISEAKSYGWAPKDQWRGKPEDHLGAREFLDKGRHLLPVLSKTNAEQRTQLAQTQAEVQGLKDALRAQKASMDALEEAHEADVAAQVEAARADLKAQLVSASRDGDHEAVADLTDKIASLPAKAEPEKGERRRASDKNGGVQIDPALQREVRDWFVENPAYTRDVRRQALANAITIELRNAGDKRVGKAFMDAVKGEVERTVGGAQLPGDTKVGAADSGGGGSRSGGKSYSDLPADAKAACDRQAQRFVGPNKAYKTSAEWQKVYTSKYFTQ